MHRPRALPRGLALLAVAAVAAVPLAIAAPSAVPSAAAAAPAACPAGTARTAKTAGEQAFERSQGDPAFADLVGTLDEAGRDRVTRCRPVAGPERFVELQAMQAERAALSAGPLGYTPPGALRAAVAGKAAATAAASTVPGASGGFRPVGKTPLIADDPAAEQVAGLGLADQAGRIDSYTYDAVHKRLFSAPGTGGVWLSTDTGQSWRSVGDALPYQAVGAVAWSPAGPSAADGTLLVNSGEASAGGNVYTGMGGFYSTDTGRTWQQSTGIPDGLMGFEIEVDPTNPKVVYAATSQGLFRSTDTGRSYVNVKLPTGACAGVTGYRNVCQNANWVTDVQIKAPGGVGPDKKGGQVLAAVGYRAGRLPYPGTDTPQAPANGVYRSDTGAPGTFAMLDVYGDGISPIGFAPQERVGRFEMGSATGPAQNHDFVYAVVEDAVLFNGGVQGIDAFDDTQVTGGAVNTTALSGIYVSGDFGSSWTRMADDNELQLPITESALIGTAQATHVLPGRAVLVQPVDRARPHGGRRERRPDPPGLRSRGGLGESPGGHPAGRRDAVARARVLPGHRPVLLRRHLRVHDSPLPTCPTQQTSSGDLTTHPDQQSGIWVPSADGGVTLIVGNDGGTYRQPVAAGAALGKDWGRGAQAGYNANTLLPYDASAAKDGTIAFGLQDNGSGVVRPDGKVVETFGGDGFYAAIDPDDSQVYYNETTLADLRVTTDGGRNYTTITPPVTAPMFSQPVRHGPDRRRSPPHGRPRGRRDASPRARRRAGWRSSTPARAPQMTLVELQGAAAYVGFCSTCDIANKPRRQVHERARHQRRRQRRAREGVTGRLARRRGQGAAGPLHHRHRRRPGEPQDRLRDALRVRQPPVVAGRLLQRQQPRVGRGPRLQVDRRGPDVHDISGSLPDVPARSIEVNRGQLVVGTDVGLFLSNNTSGQRWAALKGLPNVPVVSVKNVPGKQDRLVLATFGRGIYEYAFSARAGSTGGTGTGTGTGTGRPVVSGGKLPATGLPVAIGGIALVAVLGGLLLRRRSA